MQYSKPASVGNENNRYGMPAQGPTYARFEYIGKTGLTVTGNITGKRYRFEAHGNKQDIDYRDVPGIAGISVLKRLS